MGTTQLQFCVEPGLGIWRLQTWKSRKLWNYFWQVSDSGIPS